MGSRINRSVWYAAGVSDWVVLSCIELYWAVLSCIKLYWAVFSCTQPYWAVLSCMELYWASLSYNAAIVQVFMHFCGPNLGFYGIVLKKKEGNCRSEVQQSIENVDPSFRKVGKTSSRLSPTPYFFRSDARQTSIFVGPSSTLRSRLGPLYGQ